MSRGGRGGGRGGRGGGRGRGRPDVPWDTGDEPDARPSELFPPYAVPTPRDLSATETSAVQHFLLLRHQIHSSPLYTANRTSLDDPTAPRKTYGLEQMNARYGVKSKASVDPFTAVPTYSQKWSRKERVLPDWSARPVCPEMFPAELLDTVNPENGAGVRKRRRLELSKVSALPSAEEAFGMPSLDGDGQADAARENGKTLLERLEALGDEEGDESGAAAAAAAAEMEDEEGLEEEDEDEIYDDEDAGDYDAENYFDNGDDLGDDYGDGDDGEGTY